LAILEIKNVTKKFGDNLVVDDISINIEKGEFFTLLGPSGCGKTTLLRMIAGFTVPDSGQILLDGQDITKLPPEKRQLHTIFQSYALFPHLTVSENIAFPLKMAGWDKVKIAAQVEELLEDVQLTKFKDRYPHEMSGGQKQRVAIARSLVDRPKLLLLDEPLSALDARLRVHMHMELVKLQEETGVTFVYVTHDQQEALALSNRIAVLNRGNVEQLDKPDIIYSKPKTYFVADFLGKCNLLKAEVLGTTNDRVKLRVADSIEFSIQDAESGNYSIGQIGWYSLRPEKIKLSSGGFSDSSLNVLKSTVNGFYYYGDGTLYELTLGNNTKVQVMSTNYDSNEVKFFGDNSEVFIAFDPEAGNFLAAESC
jgi:spermidine/putrescine transport system ATP-binding protein